MMTLNCEKYATEIAKCLAWDEKCEFIKKYILKKYDCSDMTCSECERKIAQWLLEEYVPEIDWTKVPVNTPVWVRNYSNEEWKKRFFAMYIPNAENSFFCLYDGEKLCWAKGASGWRYCHLDDEVDPTPFLKDGD